MQISQFLQKNKVVFWVASQGFKEREVAQNGILGICERKPIWRQRSTHNVKRICKHYYQSQLTIPFWCENCPCLRALSLVCQPADSPKFRVHGLIFASDWEFFLRKQTLPGNRSVARPLNCPFDWHNVFRHLQPFFVFRAFNHKPLDSYGLATRLFYIWNLWTSSDCLFTLCCIYPLKCLLSLSEMSPLCHFGAVAGKSVTSQFFSSDT